MFSDNNIATYNDSESEEGNEILDPDWDSDIGDDSIDTYDSSESEEDIIESDESKSESEENVAHKINKRQIAQAENIKCEDNKDCEKKKQDLNNKLEKLQHLEKLKTSIQDSYKSITDVLKSEDAVEAKQHILDPNLEKVIELQKIENNNILSNFDSSSLVSRIHDNEIEKTESYLKLYAINFI